MTRPITTSVPRAVTSLGDDVIGEWAWPVMYVGRLAIYYVLNVGLVAFNVVLWSYQPENKRGQG